MNDFERRLQDALKNATSDYRPSDPHEAKARFMTRFRRRRYAFYGGSVALAGAAAVAAFLLLPGGLTDKAQQQPLPPSTKLEPQELSVIDVGSEPSGIAFGADAVWVANTADGTIAVIDPLTNRVSETHDIGGSPDDVAVGLGAAWASDSGSGIVTKMVFGQSDGPDIQVGEPGNHLDVAPGAGAIWVVSEGDSLYRIDPLTDEVQPVDTGIAGVSDVAAGQGRVVVLGTDTLASVDPVSLAVTLIAEVEASNNQDLQMSEGAVWVANGDAGEVTRFDLATGEAADPIYVGGNFTAIASGEDSMWMVSGDEGDQGVLTRIDPETSEIIGWRVSLGGRPYDVTTGAGSVWIVNYSAGSVTRLDPNALPEDGDTAPQEMGRPLFAFSADGDIYVEDIEGHLTQVTDGPDDDLYPSLSPDANSIAFQRGFGPAEIVIFDLLAGEESNLGQGERPSFGPDGRVVWVTGHGTGAERIVIGHPGAHDPVSIDPDPGLPPGQPIDVRNIAWDLSGEYIYYQAGWEGGFVLFQAPADGDSDAFELTPRNLRPGSAFSAPFVRGRDSVHILQACCWEWNERRWDPYETAEIGLIRFAEGGPQYSTVISIDPRDIAPDDLYLEPSLAAAGHLMLAGGSVDQRNWREGSARSWMISTSDAIWLIDEKGRSYFVSDLYNFDEYAGLSVAPQYRQ